MTTNQAHKENARQRIRDAEVRTAIELETLKQQADVARFAKSCWVDLLNQMG